MGFYLLLAFIFCLLLSAFFSGSETAFLNLRKNNKKIPSDILEFPQQTKRLLIGLLFGNTIVNICIAFLGAYFIHQIEVEGKFQSVILRFIEIVFVSLILLIFGEVIPKVFAMRNSVKFAQSVYLPLKFIFILLKPIILFFDKLVDFFHKLISIKDEKIFDSEEE